MTAGPVEETCIANEATELHRALVKRVVSSAAFAKSERLSTFLLYICDLTFDGHGNQINEQKIGTSVWGRRPDYDSASDGIVRTQASRLRQRLETYFSTEGSAEAVRIVLPRGTYVPRFESQTTDSRIPEHSLNTAGSSESPLHLEDELSAIQVRTDVGASQSSNSARILRVLPWLLCGVLALSLAASVFIHWGNDLSSTFRSLSNSNPLWRQIFVGSRPTLFVTADSGLVLFEGMAQREISLNDYVRADYRAFTAPSSDPMQAIKFTSANSRYTSVVDLAMAVGLSRVASDRATHLDIRYARDVRPNDLKSVNAVLSGAAQANPWVQLFEQHMNFILEDDPQNHVFSVFNRVPLRGEPARWDSTVADPQHRVYGVVAFVPNLTGDGDVLILEGTSMSGTEAAWDFVQDNVKLMPFLKTIENADGSLPHFELLIATSNMGSSAVETSAVAWRVAK